VTPSGGDWCCPPVTGVRRDHPKVTHRHARHGHAAVQRERRAERADIGWAASRVGPDFASQAAFLLIPFAVGLPRRKMPAWRLRGKQNCDLGRLARVISLQHRCCHLIEDPEFAPILDARQCRCPILRHCLALCAVRGVWLTCCRAVAVQRTIRDFGISCRSAEQCTIVIFTCRFPNPAASCRQASHRRSCSAPSRTAGQLNSIFPDSKFNLIEWIESSYSGLPSPSIRETPQTGDSPLKRP